MKKNTLVTSAPTLRKTAFAALICLACSTTTLAAESAGQQFFYEAYELQQAGKLPEAATKYEAGLKRDPKNAAAYYFLGELYQQFGQRDKALANYKQSLKLAPDGQYAAQAEARLSGQQRRASTSDATQIVLPSGITLFDAATMIEARMATEDPQKLMDEVARLIDKYGPVPKLMQIAGRLLDKLVPALAVNDETTARAKLPQIQQLRKTFPDNLELLRLEAAAYHYLGNFQMAKASYSQWLQKSRPDNPNRPNIVSALANIAEGKAPGPKKLPALPFSVSAEAASIIEADPAFQTSPNQKALRIRQMIRTVPRDSNRIEECTTDNLVIPIAGGVFNLRSSKMCSNNYGDAPSIWSANSYFYAGGLKSITENYCKNSAVCNDVHAVEWTPNESYYLFDIQFPLKTGDVFMDNRSKEKTKYIVGKLINASELNSNLGGHAFEISTITPTWRSKEKHDKFHYLVDYGIFTNMIIEYCARPESKEYELHASLYYSFSGRVGECIDYSYVTFNRSVTISQ